MSSPQHTAQLPDDDSIRSLLGSLKHLPPHISVRVCEQTADFLHQADFLRRALHVQAQLSGTNALSATEQEDGLDQDREDMVPAGVASQLDTLFSAASTFTPQVLDVVAQAVKCKTESVRKWFEQRNRSTRQTCKRLVKKRSGLGSDWGALFRRTQAVHADYSGPCEVRLAPRTAVESSLSLMQLLDQSDASRPKIRDATSAKAFACVTQCPSVLLQTLLLRCMEHTKQLQLMALSKSEVYTTLSQWLQDAVHAGNEELMRLCLTAFYRIPFTEVHVVTMTTHHMYDEGTLSKASRKRTDHSNPTIAEYIQRLRGPEHSTSVQRAAAQILEKWARERERTDKMVVGGPVQGGGMKQQKSSLKRPEPSAPVNIFPNDRRMKPTEAVALPLNGNVQQVKVSSAQKSSAAQRRKEAAAGPLSVADIKKRKEAEQLRREMANKRQRSAPGSAARPVAGTGAGLTPSASGIPAGGKPPSPPGGRPAGPGRQGHVGSTGQTTMGHNPPAADNGAATQSPLVVHHDEQRNENAHTQTATARNQQQKANGAGSSTPKRPESAAGERGGGNGVECVQRGASQEQRATPPAAVDRRVSAGTKGQAGPSSAQEVRAGAEGMEELLARVNTAKSQGFPAPKTGKPKKRRKLTCWMAEESLVEDAAAMLQKANANTGNCHPEVLKELNAVVKRGERVKSVRAKLKDQPSKEALDALVAGIKWAPPRTHSLSQELIKVRSSWAADSIENNEQRERAYTSSASPVSSTLSQVGEIEGIGTADDAAAEPESFPFWGGIPEGTKQNSAWWNFKDRVHLMHLAQAWEEGIRCMPSPIGIPLVGISDPQIKASRKVVHESQQEAKQEQPQPVPQQMLPPVPAPVNVLPGPPALPAPPGQRIYGQAVPAYQQQQPASGVQYMQQQQPYQAAMGHGQQQYGLPGPPAYMQATQQMAHQPGMVVNHQQGPLVHVHAHVHAQPMQPVFQQQPTYQQQQPAYQPQQPAYQQQQQRPAYQQQQPAYHQQQQPAFQQQAVHGFQQQLQQQQPANGYQQPAANAYGQPAPQVTYYQPNNTWQQQ